MLAIRLRRAGSKKRPFFRVVVADSRAARDSSFVEILGMLPGMGGMKELAANREKIDDKQLDRVEAIINSMTPQERRNHQVINGSRRKRIAKGSGTSVEEINRLLKQFVQMKKMLKAIGGMAGLGKKKGGLGMMKSLMR